jgi:hypothetical protein
MTTTEDTGTARQRGGRARALAALLLCCALVLPGLANGGDVSQIAIDPITNFPTDFMAHDVAWNTVGTMAVVVGEDSTGTYSDHLVYIYTPSTGTWVSMIDSDPGDRFYGVDYDPVSDRFYFIGYASGWYPAGYVTGAGGIVGMSDAPYEDFRDICVFANEAFVAITISGTAYCYNVGMWNPVSGALPVPPATRLTTVTYNTTSERIYIVGWDQVSGYTQLFYMRKADINRGEYVAYDANYWTGGTARGDTYAGLSADWLEGSDGYGVTGGLGECYKLKPYVDPYDWRIPEITTTSPPPRYGCAMTYDPWNQVFVMFGGFAGVTRYDDTWEFSPYTNKWTLRTAGVRPSGRYYHDMIYLPGQMAILLYGGITGTGPSTEAWYYYAGNHTWWLKNALAGPALYYHKMAFDTYNSVAILFGGYTGAIPYGNMLAFNTGTRSWTIMSPGILPSPRYGHGMAYDPNWARLVLYGGIGSSGAETETWVYNCMVGSWTQMSPSTLPLASWSHQIVYSGSRQRPVMFGGYDPTGTPYNTATYEWNFQTGDWTLLSTPNEFNPRSKFAAAEMTVAGNPFIFGGEFMGANLADVRTYDAFENVRLEQLSGVDPGYSWGIVGVGDSGREAIFASDDGRIQRHVKGTSYVVDITNPYMTGTYTCIGYKPAASPAYYMVLGQNQGIIINANFGQQQISVRAEGPHISFVCVRDTFGWDRTNGMIDVDSGTNATYYRAESVAWHNGGYGQITQVDLYMWHDGGTTGPISDAITGPAFDTAGYGNTRIHLRFYNNNWTWQQVYPRDIGTNSAETNLLRPNCYYNYDIDGKNMTVNFAFSPHQQVRASTGTFTEPVGGYYDRPPPGWNLEDQSDVGALNDLQTWDMKWVWWSGSSPSAAWDEFGFYKYTFIGASGIPGPLRGVGAPNTMIHMTPVAHVSFSANYDYRLATYVDAVPTGQNLGQQIPVANVGVKGGFLQNSSTPGEEQTFSGIGSVNALYLIGNSVSYWPPAETGRLTSTNVGPRGPVTWRCWIPNVPEDNYVTTVTYLLQRAGP